MARAPRSKRPRLSGTASNSSRTPADIYNSDLNSYSSDSDSSESVEVVNEGVVDDTNLQVVTAVEVVEASPVKQEDLSEEESTEEDQKTLISKWQVQARVAEGKALVQNLEQELLSGLSGALVHKKDPFRKLRTGFGLTDLNFCYGADQDLDYRIDRIRQLKKIAQDYETVGSCRLWRPISFPTDEE